MHELIERLERASNRLANVDDELAAAAREDLSEAIAALRSKQEPAGEPVAGLGSPLTEATVSLLTRSVRKTLRDYGHKSWDSSLPELIAANADAPLRLTPRSTYASPPETAGKVPTCERCSAELTCDVLVPDVLWARIAPRPVDGWKSGGILCPQCIADALSAKLSAAEAENASLRKLIEVKDGALPEDVVELVIAARIVAFEDQSPEAIQALDKASEAFSARVPWDDDPEDQRWPSIKEAHAQALAAAELFYDAASVEEANWSGWGEQTVPPHAEWARVKAKQALHAIRDAMPLPPAPHGEGA